MSTEAAHPLCSQCDAKKVILSYLARERIRASTAALVAENGSVAQREAAARAHEVNNAIMVIEGIFRRLEKPNAAAEAEKEDGEEDTTPKALLDR